MGLGAGLAALAFWGFVAIIIVAGIWDTVRRREAQHETLRRMIESGQIVDRDLMDKLLGINKRMDQNLRISGIIVLLAAPGLAMLGWLISFQYQPILLPLLGCAALAAFVGIGLLLAARSVAGDR
jgi:hypothetical protein